MANMKKLVTKAKAGNRDAFAEIYTATKDKAYFVAARYVGADDIADVLQDAYIAAMQNIKSFNGDKPFEPWLYTIVRNKALDLLRSRKKTVSMDDDTAIRGVEDTDEAILPESYLENEAKRRDILAIVDKLPDAQRITIVLHYFEGQTTSEISKLMSCSINTVSSRLRYGRKAIREAVLMEEERGNKLHGIVGTPFLAELFRKEMESGFYKMPSAMSAQVSSGISAGLAASSAVGGTVASAVGIGGKIAALSVGGKAVLAGICAVAMISGVAIPVYIHNENEKAVQAALILQREEQEEQSARRYELNAMKSALEAVSSEWSESAISSAKLVSLAGEFTKLNAFLLVEGDIDNIDDIKAAVEEADQIIVTLDYADPATISDLDADVKLSELRESIGTAIEALGLEDAVCAVDRIEVAQASVSGTVGDIMSIQTTIYPTMVRGSAILAWSSSDATVVDIDTDSGEMALLKDGTCTVKAIELGSGKEVTVTVTVAKKTVAGADWYTADNADQFTSQAPAQGSSSKPANDGIPAGGKKDENSYSEGDRIQGSGGGGLNVVGDDRDPGTGRDNWR